MPAPPVKAAPVSLLVRRARPASAMGRARRPAISATIHALTLFFVILTLIKHTTTAWAAALLAAVLVFVKATATVLTGNFALTPLQGLASGAALAPGNNSRALTPDVPQSPRQVTVGVCD